MTRSRHLTAPFRGIVIACTVIAVAAVAATAATPSVHACTTAAGRHHVSGCDGALSQTTTPDATTIAATAATTCHDAQTMPTPRNVEAIRTAILCLVNQERARSGEPPLRSNPALTRAAQQHSDEMVTADYFSDVAPDGETPLQRIEHDGYIPNSHVAYVIGENIGWGTLELATPAAIVRAWIASPPHLANILDRKYVETGVGVAPSGIPSRSEGNPGGVYSQEFGAIIR